MGLLSYGRAVLAASLLFAAACVGCGTNVHGCIGGVCKFPDPEEDPRRQTTADSACTVELGVSAAEDDWRELGYAVRYDAQLGSFAAEGAVADCRALDDGAVLSAEELRPEASGSSEKGEVVLLIEISKAEGSLVRAAAVACRFVATGPVEAGDFVAETTAAIRPGGETEWPGPPAAIRDVDCSDAESPEQRATTTVGS